MERIPPKTSGALNKAYAAKTNYSPNQKDYILILCSAMFNRNATLKRMFIDHLSSNGFIPTGNETSDLESVRTLLAGFQPNDCSLTARYLLSLLGVGERSLFKLESADDALKFLEQSGFRPTYDASDDRRRLILKLRRLFSSANRALDKTPRRRKGGDAPQSDDLPSAKDLQAEVRRHMLETIADGTSATADRLYASKTPNSDLLKQFDSSLANVRAIIEDPDFFNDVAFDDAVNEPIAILIKIFESAFNDPGQIVETAARIVLAYADLSIKSSDEQRAVFDAGLGLLISRGFNGLLPHWRNNEIDIVAIASKIVCVVVLDKNVFQAISRIDASKKIELSKTLISFTGDAWRRNQPLNKELLGYVIQIFKVSFSNAQLDADVLCDFMEVLGASRLDENFPEVGVAFKEIFFKGAASISTMLNMLVSGDQSDEARDLALRYGNVLRVAEDGLRPLTQAEASALRRQAILADQIVALWPSGSK